MSLPDLDSLSREDLIRLILELWRQNQQLLQRLEELERKQRGSAAPFSKGKRKANPKPAGRKPGQGEFSRRPEPPAGAAAPIEVPVEPTRCPFCGGRLEEQEPEMASVTDIGPDPQPQVSLFRVHVCRCRDCGRTTRGKDPGLAADQYGATAHRLGPRVKALAHALRYAHGIPVRRVPAVLRETTGITVTQSALTQDALKQAAGRLGAVYQQLRIEARQAPVIYTDDTGWRVGGDGAYLMAFDSERRTVYQIRRRHGNEQVREVVPGDYPGVLVTDRFSSYEAEELRAVQQHKCLAHLLRNIQDVLESKSGRAKTFGWQLQDLLRQALQLWHKQRAGPLADYAAQVEELEELLTYLLRPRRLRDPDNQRLLEGIGWQHDRGRVLTFLRNPAVEPTNNRAERALRPAVIARKVSHCSKNERGAEAFAAFTSVARTAVKQGAASVTNAYLRLMQNAATAAPN